MYANNVKDSYIFWEGNSITIIDYLEQQFIAAGWVIDKKVSSEFLDKGEKNASI